MLNKTYERFKNFIKENYKFLLFLIFLIAFFNIRLPYYITLSGGLIDLDERIEIEDKKDIKGSYNLAYVNELQATAPILIIAYFNPKWDITKESELTYDEETIEDVYKRDSLLLKEANNTAIRLAFVKADKDITVKNNKVYVVYVDKIANTDLTVGDQITKIDGKEVNSTDNLLEYIRNKEVNEKLTFEVINDNKKYNRSCKTVKENGQTIIGIMISNIYDLKTKPEVKLHFNDSESGSSGGLMTSLAIYSQLIDEEISKGRKIVGTGTIDLNGNVGSIGGVKYKLAGAVKKKADVFLVPIGENYDEALKEQKKYDYDIEIVPVKTFDEAVNYLKNTE